MAFNYFFVLGISFCGIVAILRIVTRLGGFEKGCWETEWDSIQP